MRLMPFYQKQTVEVFLEANIAGSLITIKDNGRMSQSSLKKCDSGSIRKNKKVNLGFCRMQLNFRTN